MSRLARPVALVRCNIYLEPAIAAQLRLACADTAFGGVRYGEQTRIINLALRDYFDRKEVPVCTPSKQ